MKCSHGAKLSPRSVSPSRLTRSPFVRVLVHAALPDLDTTAGSEAFITGYDSWDNDGTFYISSFSMYDSENAYPIGLNPEQIRAAEPPD